MESKEMKNNHFSIKHTVHLVLTEAMLPNKVKLIYTLSVPLTSHGWETWIGSPQSPTARRTGSRAHRLDILPSTWVSWTTTYYHPSLNNKYKQNIKATSLNILNIKYKHSIKATFTHPGRNSETHKKDPGRKTLQPPNPEHGVWCC